MIEATLTWDPLAVGTPTVLRALRLVYPSFALRIARRVAEAGHVTLPEDEAIEFGHALEEFGVKTRLDVVEVRSG